jgi:signal peptidase I
MTKSAPAPELTASQPSPQPPPPASLSRGVRETIEAIAIAFALAFLFKTFEAEAFVIPTGSMAPTLMGRHKDVSCPQCGYRYSASASEEADHYGVVKNDPQSQIIGCTCPICRYPMIVDPFEPAGKENPSYSGDRIWVSKVPYNLTEPRRWDVIVFRFPLEAETYYIKRLIGLPGETVKIFHGDIYTSTGDASEFTIQRKPPYKLRAMAQIVHDNDYVSRELLDHGWPLRWQPWSTQDSRGDWEPSEDTRTYHSDGTADGEAWMRYQHIVPPASNWGDGTWRPERAPQAQLITDFYAFNTQVTRRNPYSEPGSLGLHWVGDLIVDCELDVTSAGGHALFDLVKGGRHFRCDVDVATGRAELSIAGLADYRPTAETAIRGPGKHRIMFANADRELVLWVDDKVVTFDAPTTYDDLGNDRPSAPDDLAPLGIGTRGAAITVRHLRVLRDIYYIATRQAYSGPITDYRDIGRFVPWATSERLTDFLATPSKWQNAIEGNQFDSRQEVNFPLGADQFFVLGDNSPASSDARLWPTQHFVERDLLVGKALFVYWPHPLNLPIPFTGVGIGVIPDFSRMGFIR